MLNRGMANAKDVGVFLNARHLLALDRVQRRPGTVLDWVGTATTRLLIGGSISHQLIVADCAVYDERRLADEFALQAGFRVRHVPQEGPSASSVLSAEILSAASIDAELRVVVVADDLTALQSTFDALHQMKRWVVLLSKDWTAPSRHADLLIDLPLNRDDLFVAIAEVAQRSSNATDPAGMSNEIRKLIPNFRPAMFGYDNMAAVMRAAKEHRNTAERLRPTTRPPSAQPIASNAPADDPVAARKRTRPGADPERSAARAAVFRLSRLAGADALDDVDIAIHLLTSMTGADLKDFVARRGVDMQLFIDGLRHITGVPGWKPGDDPDGNAVPFPHLMVATADRTADWQVGQPPGRTAPSLLNAGQLPRDWNEYVPTIPKAPADAAGTSNSSLDAAVDTDVPPEECPVDPDINAHTPSG